jgi:pilus assembly protein TadC
MRQRYRRAADLATLVGAIAGLGVVAARWPALPGAFLQREFLMFAIASILLGALVPRLLVKLWWRMLRRRNHEEWG